MGYNQGLSDKNDNMCFDDLMNIWLTSKHENVRVWFVLNETFLLCLVDQDCPNAFALTAIWQKSYALRIWAVDSNLHWKWLWLIEFEWCPFNILYNILIGHNVIEHISSLEYTNILPNQNWAQVISNKIATNRHSRPKICRYNRLPLHITYTLYPW